MTNICFPIFGQIRAKFRLFLLCWSVFYFQFTRSNPGEQVSLNKMFLSLAKDNNIEMNEKHLIEKAQRLALIKGTRSPRIAKQLIDNLLAHVII